MTAAGLHFSQTAGVSLHPRGKQRVYCRQGQGKKEKFDEVSLLHLFQQSGNFTLN